MILAYFELPMVSFGVLVSFEKLSPSSNYIQVKTFWTYVAHVLRTVIQKQSFQKTTLVIQETV